MPVCHTESKADHLLLTAINATAWDILPLNTDFTWLCSCLSLFKQACWWMQWEYIIFPGALPDPWPWTAAVSSSVGWGLGTTGGTWYWVEQPWWSGQEGLHAPAHLFHPKASVSQLESALHGKTMQMICKPEGRECIYCKEQFSRSCSCYIWNPC